VLRQQEQKAAQHKRGPYKKAAWEEQADPAAKSMAELCLDSVVDENHCHLRGKED
jgi:hypothetical protein